MNLISYLGKSGVSRAEFSRLIGKSHSYVTMLCAGTFWPGRSMMLAILQATQGKVTPNDLLGVDVRSFKPKQKGDSNGKDSAARRGRPRNSAP